MELMCIVAVPGGILVPRFRNKDHVTLEVPSGLVMLSVRNLPRKVWNKQGRMAEPPDGVIEGLGGRERLMSALVCQHPETGTEKALDKGISSPKHSTNRGRRDILWRYEIVKEVECGGE